MNTGMFLLCFVAMCVNIVVNALHINTFLTLLQVRKLKKLTLREHITN